MFWGARIHHGPIGACGPMLCPFHRLQVCLMGFSLGANVVAKFVGEEGIDCRLAGAIALAAPVDCTVLGCSWCGCVGGGGCSEVGINRPPPSAPAMMALSLRRAVRTPARVAVPGPCRDRAVPVPCPCRDRAVTVP